MVSARHIIVNRYIAVLFIFLLLSTLAYAEDTTYVSERYGFSIAYPSNFRILRDWQKVPLIIFLPKEGFSLYNDNVSITVTSVPLTDRPIEEYVDIHFKYSKSVLERKEKEINGIKFRSITQTQQRRLLFFRLDLKLHYWIAVKGTKIYIITYTAASNSYDKQLEGASRIAQTFRFTE